MSGILYLCATPIGNLGDITLRALETLKSVDLIAAEDTRHSLKLINHFDISAPLTSYHEHNKYEKGEYLLDRLKSGLNVALISDAGMPAISDPGEVLVKLCIQNNITVIPLPGASAFTTALIASGLSTSRFAFEGFLEANKKIRAERLDNIKSDTRTLIFYEAPHKLLSTLEDMLRIFGDRKIVIARELTKKYEEFYRGTISESIEYYNLNPPKGEFVLIAEGISQAQLEEEKAALLPNPEELLTKYMNEGMKGKELTKKVASELNLPNREVYELYLKLKQG